MNISALLKTNPAVTVRLENGFEVRVERSDGEGLLANTVHLTAKRNGQRVVSLKYASHEEADTYLNGLARLSGKQKL